MKERPSPMLYLRFRRKRNSTITDTSAVPVDFALGTLPVFPSCYLNILLKPRANLTVSFRPPEKRVGRDTMYEVRLNMRNYD